LQNLKGETFVSHTSNALKENAVGANAQGGTTTATSYSINSFKMTLPAKSITAVLLATATPKQIDAIAPARSTLAGKLLHHESGNWFIDNGSGNVHSVSVFNSLGQSVLQMSRPTCGNIRIASEVLGKGNFFVSIRTASGTQMQKITVK
jgi:hypothetical protein